MSREMVAIIGAGPSGIACTRACLEEGLEPVCFEQFDYVGGVWHFTPDVLPGQGAVTYETLMTNTSKTTTCFGDMPFPDSAPQYLSHTQVKEYLERYVEQFDLKRYINLQHRVLKVHPSQAYAADGSWLATVRDLVNELTKTLEFKRVVVCNGKDSFQGEVTHAISYRAGKQFSDRDVLVVGKGNSAGDLVVEACQHAKRVHLSVGGGTWITPLQGHDGKGSNLDLLFTYLLCFVPLFILNWIMMRNANKGIDHRRYGIAPADNKGPIYSSGLANSKIADYIRRGAITIKPSLIRLAKRSAWFDDGSHIDGVDLVIFATGYKPDWNLVSSSLQQCSWEDMPLFKRIWPTHFKHHTLAFVAVTGVIGPEYSSLELQAMWVAAVFSSRLRLPTAEQMNEEVSKRQERLIKRYGRQNVNSLEFQNELVDELGIQPPFFRTLFTRPMDLYRWYVGPASPMLNRLYGTHYWDGARNAIDMTLRWAQDDRCERVNGVS